MGDIKEPEYKLLKDYGDFYAGDIVTPEELADDASVLLEEGTIELVIEDIKVDAPAGDTPSVDDAPTPETPVAPKGKAKYKVIGPIDIFDGSGQKQGQYRTDQVVELDIEVGETYVEQGLAQLVEEE